jgi:hypothetical protein
MSNMPEISKKLFMAIVAIVVIVAIAALALFFVLPQTGLLTAYSQEDVLSKVKTVFELSNPGTIINIENVKEESGLYKILLKARTQTGDTYNEIYVTKDGKFLIQNPISIQDAINNIKKLNSLVDCLDAKGVRIYGLTNDTGTLMQYNVLGRNSLKLFIFCDNILEQCINAGITEVPSIVINSTIYKGARTPEWLAQTAGC